MKAHEEWYNENCDNFNMPYYYTRTGWKAALEWALKILNEQYERLAPGDMGWEGKFIEKELNDE